jgi:hypothetical protein
MNSKGFIKYQSSTERGRGREKKYCMITVAILLIVMHYFFSRKRKIRFAHVIIIFYTACTLFDRYMKVTAIKEERPMLLVVVVAAAGSINSTRKDNPESRRS